MNKNQILDIDDLPTETITIPEWKGVKLAVRTLTATEREAFEATIATGKGKVPAKDIRAKLLVRTVVDPETGLPLFTDSDVPKLANKSAAAVSRAFDVAARLCGLSQRDVEELEKNSESDPSNSSSTASA